MGKRLRLESIYAGLLLIIFTLIVVHAPLTVFVGTRFPDYELVIKAWKEILMLSAALLALILVVRRRLWEKLIADRIVRLAGAYSVLHSALLAFRFQGPAAAAAGLMIDLRYILFFLLVYVLVRAEPGYRQLFVKCFYIGAAIVGGFAFLQLFLPPNALEAIGYGPATIESYLTVDKNPAFIRLNGTLRGPNPLGAYAVIVLSLMAAWLLSKPSGKAGRRDRHRLYLSVALFALATAALWNSYSRSALVAGVVGVGLVAALMAARRLSRRAWIVGIILTCALSGAVLMLLGAKFVSIVFLHDDPNGGALITSNEGHGDSLLDGFGLMLRQPLGGGIGSTGSASLFGPSPLIIENQYLFVAHEVGWLGLALFIGLFSLILWRLWRRRSDWLACGAFASGVGLALIGLLLPVWADDTVGLVWWGLAAVALGGSGWKSQTSGSSPDVSRARSTTPRLRQRM